MLNTDINTIFIMGVSGCGKSTIGSLLSSKLSWSFKDGDSFHSPQNIEKMRAGTPLTDSDRIPWLQEINKYARDNPKCVIACSSLKKSYREVLSEGIRAKFVFLRIPKEILESRVSSRRDHFMPAGLLDSQLATLELPGPDECNVIVIDVEKDSESEIVSKILEKLE